MEITATLKIYKNHLTYKQAYTYSKVVITVCLSLVVTTDITLYFEQVTANKTGAP